MVHGFELLKNMGKTFKLISCEIRRRMALNGIQITREQGLVLKRLMVDDGISQNVLSEETDRDKTATARIIARMEGNDLVIRKSDPSDLRVKRVFITKHGRVVAKKINQILSQLVQEYFSDISIEQQHKTYETLKMIQEKIKKDKIQ